MSPTGVYQRTEEHKRKISEASRGRRLSVQHKRKISEAKKGKKHSEEHKRNISESMKGWKRSEKVRRKQFEAQMNIGVRYLRLMDRIFSEGHKRRLSKAKKSRNRTELTDEMIGLMCVQTKYFSGRTYRSRIEIIMLAYQSIFRRRREEAKLHDE